MAFPIVRQRLPANFSISNRALLEKAFSNTKKVHCWARDVPGYQKQSLLKLAFVEIKFEKYHKIFFAEK